MIRIDYLILYKDRAGLRGKEKVMDDTQMAQMAMDVAMTKKSLDFQASMNAALINGSFEKAAELQANMSRNAGLAAQGIGANLNITV